MARQLTERERQGLRGTGLRAVRAPRQARSGGGS
jgi:hypothetical protein